MKPVRPTKWEYFVGALCDDVDLECASDRQFWEKNPPEEAQLWRALWSAANATHYFHQSTPHPPFEPSSAVPDVVRSVLENCDSTVWWDTPIDRVDQRIVEWLEDDPTPLGQGGLSEALSEWTLRASQEGGDGPWWSAPLGPSVIRTSRSTPFAPAVHLVADEDDMGRNRARIHVASPIPSDARIYEISSASDWVALVDSAPLDVSISRDENWGERAPIYQPFPLPALRSKRPATTWWLPNWAKLASEYDGIHLTTWAYLDLSGIPIPARTGNTMIAGWSPDETVWLNQMPAKIASTFDIARLDDATWTPNPM
ncbi:hypothetical protein [Mycetocola manganoxydans]|uniref:hypothetical protein n=1 Tax=Mycetocola manganoxydans TaxID=699879 RepID=UPI0011C4092A|nr:hypothetical protein [Mycetocola manganoxydans]